MGGAGCSEGEGRREESAYHTPMKSMLTSMQKATLNALDSLQSGVTSVVYISYAKGTCW